MNKSTWFAVAALITALVVRPAEGTVLIDSPWSNTSQINVTPFASGSHVVAGVNFINSSPSSPGAATLLGIGFDDVDVDPASGAVYNFTTNTGGGFFNLTANGPGPTLQTRFGFLHHRHDTGPPVGGPDAGVANIVRTDIHTICHVRADDCHEQEMTLGNLPRNTNVYLQFFGGDEGWNGDLDFFVNGVLEGTWTSNTDNPSTFGFTTTTSPAGQLDIDMNIVAPTNFAGVSAFYVIAQVPEPSTLLLAVVGLAGLIASLLRTRR